MAQHAEACLDVGDALDVAALGCLELLFFASEALDAQPEEDCQDGQCGGHDGECECGAAHPVAASALGGEGLLECEVLALVLCDVVLELGVVSVPASEVVGGAVEAAAEQDVEEAELQLWRREGCPGGAVAGGGG